MFITGDNGLWNVTVRIPPGITCTQCVLQMRYKAGEFPWQCLEFTFNGYLSQIDVNINGIVMGGALITIPLIFTLHHQAGIRLGV